MQPAGAFFALCVGAADATPLAAQQWSAFVNPGLGTASFDVVFERAFDQAAGDSFQFWVAQGTHPIQEAYDVVLGAATPSTQRVLEFARAPGRVDVVAVLPTSWWDQHQNDPDASLGGWGQILGSSSFAAGTSELQFIIPLTLLGNVGTSLHYEFQTYWQGAGSDVTYWGQAGAVWTPETAAAPEASTWTIMLGGLAAVLVFRRSRPISRRALVRAIPSTGALAVAGLAAVGLFAMPRRRLLQATAATSTSR